MRTALVITSTKVISLPDGEVYSRDDLLDILEEPPGCKIFVWSSYGAFGNLMKDIQRRDKKWKITLTEKGKRKSAWIQNAGGSVTVRYLSIERKKVRTGPWEDPKGAGFKRKQVWTKALKHTVINMAEWQSKGPDKILDDARAIMALTESRGVKVRSSMGATAGAMIRASSEWPRARKAATWNMEPIARRYLPGGHLALREGEHAWGRALYIDQRSAHLNIAASEFIPASETLRFRGFTLAAEKMGIRRHWFSPDDICNALRPFVGLYYATVYCEPIPEDKIHCYPWWAREPGEREIAIWSPELALLDDYVKLLYVSGGLLAHTPDWATCEYATWALEQQEKESNKIIKPLLLSGIGMLGANPTLEFSHIVVGADHTPRKAEAVDLHLFGKGYRYTWSKKWHGSLQNPVALGIIQAHCKVKTLQLARRLEGEGIPVAQIAADAVITGGGTLHDFASDGSPFVPKGWKADTLINWRTYGIENQVLCDNHPKIPGIQEKDKQKYLDARQFERFSVDLSGNITPERQVA